MKKCIYPFAILAALLVAGWVGAQGMIMDMLATKVVAKYQNASCEQLRQQKDEPKPQEEQRAVQFLKNDPQARTAFINKIAGPVVNKMFECGMIP